MNNEQTIRQPGIDLKEGTIEFWVKENKVQWNDNQSIVFVNFSNPEGSIFIVKDNDNKLKFFHVILGKGRTDAELDVSLLSNNERHYIAATWSLSKKEIALYIDGGKFKNSSSINYV